MIIIPIFIDPSNLPELDPSGSWKALLKVLCISLVLWPISYYIFDYLGFKYGLLFVSWFMGYITSLMICLIYEMITT